MAYRIKYEPDVSQEQKGPFEAAFKAARVLVTQGKNELESQWFAVAGGTPLNNAEKWFATHYETAGKLIGQRRRLEAVMEQLTKGGVYTAVRAGPAWNVSKDDTLLCVVSTFVPGNEDVVHSITEQRAVFKINNKEYVLDDDNVPTRRFAYTVRPPNDDDNAPMLKPIEGLNTLKPSSCNVRFKDNAWKAALTGAIKAIKDGRRDQWHSLDVKVKVCLAYINYAYNGGVGVCLSSTPKRIRDNEGVAFLDNVFLDGVNLSVWKVDLAKVPTTAVLINIYARELENELPEDSLGQKKLLWVAQGTVKNRELFCSEVPPTATRRILATTAMLEEQNWSWKTMDVFLGDV
jgi:hypothetical protein